MYRQPKTSFKVGGTCNVSAPISECPGLNRLNCIPTRHVFLARGIVDSYVLWLIRFLFLPSCLAWLPVCSDYVSHSILQSSFAVEPSLWLISRCVSVPSKTVQFQTTCPSIGESAFLRYCRVSPQWLCLKNGVSDGMQRGYMFRLGILWYGTVCRIR